MTTPRLTPEVRALLRFGEQARDVADRARSLVMNSPATQAPGELLRDTIAWLRRPVLDLTEQAIVLEILRGTSWAVVADALGIEEEAARARYSVLVAMVRDGMPTDHDPEPSDPTFAAAALDQWIRRHNEPWEMDVPAARGPVTRALDRT